MARRISTIAAAISVGAALLLTACGSSGDGSPDNIEGADKGSSPSTSASADGNADAQRPEITLPKSFQMTFEGWTSSDPEKQTILNDGKERLRAVHAAIIENNPEADYLAFYSGPSALSASQSYARTYTSKNLTLVGKATVFNPKLNLISKKRGTLFYCMDESKGFTKDRKSGAKEGNPKGVNPHVLYMTGVQKDPDGVWKTATVESKRGGC